MTAYLGKQSSHQSGVTAASRLYIPGRVVPPLRPGEMEVPVSGVKPLLLYLSGLADALYERDVHRCSACQRPRRPEARRNIKDNSAKK